MEIHVDGPKGHQWAGGLGLPRPHVGPRGSALVEGLFMYIFLWRDYKLSQNCQMLTIIFDWFEQEESSMLLSTF